MVHNIRSIVRSDDFGNYVRAIPENALLPKEIEFSASYAVNGYSEVTNWRFCVQHNGANICTSATIGDPYGKRAKRVMARSMKRAAKVIAKIESIKLHDSVAA